MRYQDFEKAFAEAFTDYESLRLLFKRHFDKNLNDIVAKGTALATVRLEVFDWAESHGSLKELLHAATAECSNHEGLKALYQRFLEEAGANHARVPLPPTPYFAHSYPLQRHFTGRIAERTALTKWWLNGSETVVAVTAIGGMGKSSLTWAWIQQDVLDNPLDAVDERSRVARMPQERRPVGIFWWSFYEQDAHFDAFLHDLICYVGEGAVDPSLANEPLKKWIHLLDQKPILVVMDGFERELREYARMDASLQDESANPVARGRRCTRHRVSTFLQAISARRFKTRFLLTSRLMPEELDSAAYCRPFDLRQLAEEDALAFFRSQGVRGTETVLRTLCERYGYHPLALRLLSGAIIKHPVRGGDVGVALEVQPVANLKRREHHVLEWAYEALPAQQAELLSRVAAFRSTIEYEAVLAISPFSNEAALQEALADLSERGFVFVDGANRRYDLHPVVREYAYARLHDKRGTALRLIDYFGRVPVPKKVGSINHLRPLIELYHHTIASGNLDAAVRLYKDRILQPLAVELGEDQQVVELLQRLFPNGELAPPKVSQAHDSVVRWLADSLVRNGDVRRAMAIIDAALARMSPDEAQTGGTPLEQTLGTAYLHLGELHKAENVLDSALARIPSWDNHGRGHVFEMQFYLANGRGDRARALALRKQMGKAWSTRNDAKHNFILARCDEDLEVGTDSARLKAVETLEQRASEYGAPAALAIAQATRANFLLWRLEKKPAPPTADEDLAVLEQLITASIVRATEQHDLSSECQWRFRLARWHMVRGELEPAEQEINEALAIAEARADRGAQADILVTLGAIAEERSDIPLALKHYERARQLAECDGRPYCFATTLDAAEKALKRLSKKGTRRPRRRPSAPSS